MRGLSEAIARLPGTRHELIDFGLNCTLQSFTGNARLKPAQNLIKLRLQLI